MSDPEKPSQKKVQAIKDQTSLRAVTDTNSGKYNSAWSNRPDPKTVLHQGSLREEQVRGKH